MMSPVRARRAPYEIVARFGATKRVGVETVKREAIRRCRAMTLHLGAGASGEVRRQGLGRTYRCFAVAE
jgi:hypothetical protein